MSTKERIKSVLICVLLVGVIYLTYSVWFYNSPFGEWSIYGIFNMTTENTGVKTGNDDADLNRFGIRPMSILLRDDVSARGVIYKMSESDAIYDKLRDSFKKAIASAESAQSVGSGEWNEVIKSKGVLYDYFGDIPISAVSKWITGSYRDELTEKGRYFFLSVASDTVSLYVKDDAEETVVKYKTKLTSKELLSAIEVIAAPSATLACESAEEDFQAVDPEMLIVENRAIPSVLSAYNPMTAFAEDVTDSVLSRFKLAHASPNTYSEQDGTQVYVADMITLKISPNGTVAYNDTRDEIDDTLGIGIESKGETPTIAEATEGARRFVEGIASDLPGSGGIYIADTSRTEDGYEIIFARHVEGIPIDIADTAYFAKITTKKSSVGNALINMRSFDIGTSLSETMNERIAAAAMKGSGQKGELCLRYADTGSGTAYTAWYIGDIKS